LFGCAGRDRGSQVEQATRVIEQDDSVPRQKWFSVKVLDDSKDMPAARIVPSDLVWEKLRPKSVEMFSAQTRSLCTRACLSLIEDAKRGNEKRCDGHSH
jgi:hypothetical protein